jgi:uncharacterized protein YecE (DUF72 family)
MKTPVFRIGTAGWTVPKEAAPAFSKEGSHLERYASRLNAVEINSSFYKDHQASSYRRWGEAVPKDFRFSVKLSKVFTHERKLVKPGKDLQLTLNGISELGEKLGCLLIQLPPSLEFDSKTSKTFLKCLKEGYAGNIAVEPRHESWLSEKATDLLNDFGAAFVRSDPGLLAPEETIAKIVYYRLHGSPVRYRSKYTVRALMDYAREMKAHVKAGRDVWCVFDNTMYGHATTNALALRKLIGPKA